MGKKKRQWQDIEYVLGFFGKRIGKARKEYRSYVEKGIPMGRRPELVGGGLIRSLGGCGMKSKRLDMTLAAVSYAVKRGEKIAKEAGCLSGRLSYLSI
ncbi:MAG: hypothetical protein JRD93_04485 [Deltaproteobacteria bacterium]|nr:hypothetical protein [Deltaproteobacteria bacterium]MBW2661247.1 hypothetical protein [Deltaproteobacteria bacterium]